MYYFMALSAGLLIGYAISKRKENVSSLATAPPSSTATTVIKFIGKKSAIIDIGKGVKLHVPVSIIDSKFSGRLRLSLEKKNGAASVVDVVEGSTSSPTTSTWMPISTKIIEYQVSENEICVFPPFTIQNKILTTLAVELVSDVESISSTDPEKVLQRSVVSDAQRYVNLFPLGWWNVSIEDVIKNQ